MKSFSFSRKVLASALVVAYAMGAASATAAPAQTGCATATVLKEHANGTFLENLDRAADGNLYYTSYFSKELYRWNPDQGVTLFATLQAHPVSISVLPTGFLVAAHGKPFSEGPAFTKTNQFCCWTSRELCRRPLKRLKLFS